MIYNTEDIKKIKVEISLEDLSELTEKAKMYYSAANERDLYYKKMKELEEKLNNIEKKD